MIENDKMKNRFLMMTRHNRYRKPKTWAAILRRSNYIILIYFLVLVFHTLFLYPVSTMVKRITYLLLFAIDYNRVPAIMERSGITYNWFDNVETFITTLHEPITQALIFCGIRYWNRIYILRYSSQDRLLLAWLIH